MTPVTAVRASLLSRAGSERGFTMIELLVSSLIMVVVTGAIFSLMNPAQTTFQVQPEVSDLQQRVRIGVDTLQKDLVMAGAGTYNGQMAGALNYFIAPIMPYRAFGATTDPSQGVFFRDDTVSLIYVPPTPSQTTISQPMPPKSSEIKVNEQPNCPPGKGNELCGFSQGDQAIIFDQNGNWDMFLITQVQDEAIHMQHRADDFTVGYATNSSLTQAVSAMYYLISDDATQTYQLMYFDGWNTDLPVVDNVVSLQFRYFGDPQPPRLTGKPLTDTTGPWTTYGPKPPTLLEVRGLWPAGENCAFQVVGGQQEPRLAVLGAGGLGQVELTKDMLTDGPWCSDAAKPNRFDADLLRVRRVRATMRVQAALASMRGPAGALFMKGGTAQAGTRFIPDQEVSFDVTPRNLNLGR
jgi:prepilin-type N-terminal cleavage/methylation domain-containing protein